MAYKIDKGVKVPENCRGRGQPSKYPFAEMEIGDSVFFADEARGTMSKPVLAARQHANYHDKKMAARKEGNGVRIWRVA